MPCHMAMKNVSHASNQFINENLVENIKNGKF